MPDAATDAGRYPSIVEPSGALLMPSHNTPLVGISAYVTLTTVVAPASRTARVIDGALVYVAREPVLAVVTRAAVTMCGPAGRGTVELAVTGAERPLTVTAPGLYR